MTDFAYRALSTEITFTPAPAGSPPVPQMYRLPTMMPGVFQLTAAASSLPPGGHPASPNSPGASTQPGGLSGPGSPAHPGGFSGAGSPAQPASPSIGVPGDGASGIVADAGQVETNTVPSAGLVNPGGPADPADPPGGVPVAQPGELVMELYHQGNLVATGANALPMQNTPAEGDDTWTVGLSLAPGTSQGATYPYIISLSPFPSVLPIVTRRIPLAFFQQGFDENWNGRDYVHLEIEANTLMVSFDPELRFLLPPLAGPIPPASAVGHRSTEHSGQDQPPKYQFHCWWVWRFARALDGSHPVDHVHGG